jgi:anti-sigma factor ChrR (cupin superfamily)
VSDAVRPREELLLEAAAVDALEGREPLSPEQRALLGERYLAARDGFEAARALLGLAAPQAEASPSLRARLLDRIAGTSLAAQPVQPERPAGSFDVIPGVSGVRTDEAPWIAAPLPGVSYKLISRDEERGYTTRLVRFDPGARYPTHRHGGTEEIFVLEGTVWVNGTLLKAGDYCRSDEGTEEVGTFTEDGAMAIVVSSDRDEISA